jgi:3-hydroxyacyl-CoA dehydrogenase
MKDKMAQGPEVRDGIAIVTVDNPPVNALGAASIAPVIEGLDAAIRDTAVTAIVLRGAGGNFSGGADMKGFGKAASPTLRDLLDVLEASPKPVVAALDGHVLGGGLELALSCDYRVAAPRARLALPEIKRGLLPGAGGTQRLPRLIGAEAALEMILGGEPIDATRAHALGLVDELATGDVLDAALAFARAKSGAARRRASDLTAAPDDAAIAAARKRADPEARGGLAQHRAIDAVDDALHAPFADGMRRERERFVELLSSEQSKARIHLFFAEREAARLPEGVSPAPEVKTAVVLGAGTMGSGIAMTCANVGIRTTLVDLKPELVERARAGIAANYASTVKKGRLSQAEMDARLALIDYATTLDAAADVDLVIEAVFEEMDIKRDVFQQFDRITKPGTLLATNTSTLDIDAIAEATSRPQDVIGTHFFSPANVMKLLEIVRGKHDTDVIIGRTIGLAKQLKKIPVVSGNCDGFIGNRMLYPYRRQAEFLLEEGATPQQIDRVIQAFGLPMGPFAMADLAGLDVGWRIRKRRNAEKPPVGRYSKIADRLCEMDRFGQKTRAGYYRYDEGSRTPLPDPIVDEVIAGCAREAGIERRAISDEEIIARCMYALVNEGAAILDEGIAARSGDIDVVYVYGYGFPAFRGGPMRWADSLGLRRIYEEMLGFEKVHGAVWKPARLLQELAASDATFGAWKREVAHA